MKENDKRFSILFESFTATGKEPPRISGLYSRFIEEGGLDSFTGAQIKLIFHLLPNELKTSLASKIQEMDTKFWAKHADFRRTGYEAIVGKATAFRPDVANFVSPLSGDQIVDLGGAFGIMAPYLAGIAKNIEYYDVDIIPPVKGPATELIGRLKNEGSIAEGGYVEHNIADGFPKKIPAPKNGRRIAVSVASASYLYADKLQNLVKSSFENGCQAFYLIALRDDFSAEAVVQQVEARALLLEQSDEGREILKNARAGYDGLLAFGKEITIGLPVRSPQETAEYLARVGKVTKAAYFGTQTFGIVVEPQ